VGALTGGFPFNEWGQRLCNGTLQRKPVVLQVGVQVQAKTTAASASKPPAGTNHARFFVR
jgi:hypothetical protein